MDLMAQLAAEKKAAQDIIAKGMENITPEEQQQLKEHYEQAKSFDERITLFKEASAGLDRMGMESKGRDRIEAKTLGDFYMQSLQAKGLSVAQTKNSPFVTEEFKASSDVHTAGSGRTTDTGYQPFVTEIDRNGVWPYERPLVIADQFDTGTLSGNTIE